MRQTPSTIKAMIEEAINFYKNQFTANVEKNSSGSSTQKTYDEDSAAKFFTELEKHLEKESKGFSLVASLHVGKHPEPPLSDIIRKSGIEKELFTKKTTLWVDFKKGIVRYQETHGNGETLYPKTR